MGERIRQLDWSQTLLGPVLDWPLSLRTAVNIMLGSRFPMMVHWGPALVHFYNDGYAAILQDKHPGALGQPAEPWWAEMWPFLLTIFRPVLAGQTTYFEDSLVLPNRQGFVEETYFTFSHSPIHDEAGQVGGIFVTALETTTAVLQRRRLALLSHLTAQTTLSVVPAEAAQHLVAALATNPEDLPFALLYAREAAAPRAQLQAWYGLPAGEPQAPTTLAADPGRASPAEWPLAEALQRAAPLLVEDLPARFPNWALPATRALLLPLLTAPAGGTAFALIVGLSAHLPLNGAYQDFIALVADYSGRALARATALDEAQRLNQVLRLANTSLDSFVHIVAHDLKSPVTNLTQLLEVYQQEAAGPEREAVVSLVDQEVQRLAATIHGLLRILHAQHSAAATAAETVVLADVYAVVQAETRELRHQQAGQLTADFAAAPTVHFPRVYVESILKNLVSNALKYRAPERPPQVAVRSYRQGAAVVLVVADNGRGIDLARDRQRLFAPFTRLTAEGEGVGLGLHLTQILVQQRGGSLDVQSTLGQGTTFTLVLPDARAS